jgi:predicted N-acetyltransferase YhbS
MKIRKINKNDLEACSKILEEAYSQKPYNETFKDSTTSEYINGKYKNCGENSFVATDDNDVVVAFIFLNISSWSGGLQAILEEIAVTPSLQGVGIGKELISHAHNYLSSLGAKSVMLWAKKDDRLLDFYKKHGYLPADDFVVMFKNF